MKEQLEKYKKLFSLMFDDLKTKGNRHKQIPNILTMLRLVAPLVVIPAFATGNFIFAFWSIVAFAATDAVDGFIARTFKLTSELGRDLDTIADKLFAATLLISLSTVNPIYIISLVLEGVIGSICSYKKIHNIDIRTCKVGKIKTILLDLFVILGMGSILFDISPLVLNMLCISTTILQISTIKEYMSVHKEIDTFESKCEIKEKNNNYEPEDEEKVYTKTITYPKSYYTEQNKEKKLVKTREKNRN